MCALSSSEKGQMVPFPRMYKGGPSNSSESLDNSLVWSIASMSQGASRTQLRSTVASPHHPKYGANSHFPRKQVLTPKLFLVDSALLRRGKQTYPQQIEGPHRVYQPGRGREVNRPLVWDDEVSPLLTRGA